MQSGYAKIALVKLAATQHIVVEKSVQRFFYSLSNVPPKFV